MDQLQHNKEPVGRRGQLHMEAQKVEAGCDFDHHWSFWRLLRAEGEEPFSFNMFQSEDMTASFKTLSPGLRPDLRYIS